MKYIELDKPVLAGEKYVLMGYIILEAKIVTESGVLFSVVSRQKASAVRAKVGSEFFTHNNDKDFWSGLKEYVPPPIKKKVFVIVWLHSERVQCITDQDDFSAHSWIKLGWTPVKGFEVEYYVPQVSD